MRCALVLAEVVRKLVWVGCELTQVTLRCAADDELLVLLCFVVWPNARLLLRHRRNVVLADQPGVRAAPAFEPFLHCEFVREQSPTHVDAPIMRRDVTKRERREDAAVDTDAQVHAPDRKKLANGVDLHVHMVIADARDDFFAPAIIHFEEDAPKRVEAEVMEEPKLLEQLDRLRPVIVKEADEHQGFHAHLAEAVVPNFSTSHEAGGAAVANT